MISLDFELHWGIRDHVTQDDALYGRLPRARAAVADMVQLFVSRDIRATWATVGFLFASTRDEVDECRPDERPTYSRSELDPYVEGIGIDEQHDPEHLAASLVELIRAGHGQEVGSHTFSHYYCLEPGQDEATFRADLSAARAIAKVRALELTSLVLPRNQWNPAYETAVLDLGFNCIRVLKDPGVTMCAARRPQPFAPCSQAGGHLHWCYTSSTTAWSEVALLSGLCNVPASAFLRPYNPARERLEPLRLARLRSGLRHAAHHGHIFHLWWHPHSFQHQPENFAVLGQILDDTIGWPPPMACSR